MANKQHNYTTYNGVSDDRFNDPIVKWYVENALQEPLIDTAEETRLSEMAKSGDSDAFNRIVLSNLRLVVSIAKDYPVFPAVGFMDLIAAGNRGLMRSIETFDSRKAKLSTYASWWIKQSIKLELSRNSSLIRIPTHLRDNSRKIAKSIDNLTLRSGHNPTLEEIARDSDLDLETVENILKTKQRFVSLDSKFEDSSNSLADVIEDEGAIEPGQSIMMTDSVELIKSFIEKLSNRQRAIIINRFGLNGKKVMTLEEIGVEFRLTRERIRQIQESAIQRLGELMGVRKRQFKVYKTTRKKRRSKK